MYVFVFFVLSVPLAVAGATYCIAGQRIANMLKIQMLAYVYCLRNVSIFI